MSNAREKFEKLLRELNALFHQGKDESPEADAVRDEMDKPWHEMSEDERHEMRALSAALYKAPTAVWFEPTDEQRTVWAAWVTERPPVVRAVAEKFPPWSLWRLDLTGEDGKPTGRFQRVFVLSFGETDRPEQPVTLTIAVDGRFNAVAFERSVFGIDPADLMPCDLPGPNDPVGSAGLSVEDVKQMMHKDRS